TLVLTDNDGVEGTDSVSIDLIINAINDDPVIEGDVSGWFNWTQDEDFGSFWIDLSTNKSDVDDINSELTWRIEDWDNGSDIAMYHIDGDVIYFWDITDEFGTDTFTLVLTDNDGVEGTDSVSIDLIINAINDDPVIEGDVSGWFNWTQDEDFGSFWIDLSTNKSDVDDINSELTWRIEDWDNGSDIAMYHIAGDVIYFWDITDEFGTDTFTLVLTDNDGVEGTDSVS
ncbi:MAG: hypothetical protein GY836_09080, partial [Herbaspirillum sp.]|uniref:hypothetical protein n=1 Tax=Herbaspirillum sp. TaxID=1890675 RepID=UPI00258D5302